MRKIKENYDNYDLEPDKKKKKTSSIKEGIFSPDQIGVRIKSYSDLERMIPPEDRDFSMYDDMIAFAQVALERCDHVRVSIEERKLQLIQFPFYVTYLFSGNESKAYLTFENDSFRVFGGKRGALSIPGTIDGLKDIAMVLEKYEL